MYLDIHTHSSSQSAGVLSVQSLNVTQNVFLAMPKQKPISVGLHPWDASLANLEVDMRYLRVLAQQKNVKLIGECGLDKLKGETLHNQLIILESQFQLADEFRKPLIIHCVKAYDELIALKDRTRLKVPIIIHGFNKNAQLGNQLVKQGFQLSFGEALFKASDSLLHLFTQLDEFFLETDNSTITIEEIYARAAFLKNCSVDELKARIFENWEKLMNNG